MTERDLTESERLSVQAVQAWRRAVGKWLGDASNEKLLVDLKSFVGTERGPSRR